MFQYIPKKSKEIYEKKIAHRGLHLNFPENTLPAYIEAINKNYAIELDVRLTKDNQIICIHDRHTKRLLGKRGKTSKIIYDEIKMYNVLNSKEKIPLLKDVLRIIAGRVPILIEVKGYFNKRFKSSLIRILNNYNGKVYFHAKNIFTFFKLRSLFKDRVFWILNPFRKRFDFIKTHMYKNANKLIN